MIESSVCFCFTDLGEANTEIMTKSLTLSCLRIFEFTYTKVYIFITVPRVNLSKNSNILV
jgi:hypothetical protein